MRWHRKKLIAVLLMAVLLLSLGVTACAGSKGSGEEKNTDTDVITVTAAPAAGEADSGNKKASGISGSGAAVEVEEDGEYTSKEEVALYLHTYGHLPSNFITKQEAGDLGWRGGSLKDYAPGKSIGGSRFGNYEGQLPEKTGRQYYECDIDYTGGKRGAKRIIWSDDGLIFYTDDHYKTFEQLY